MYKTILLAAVTLWVTPLHAYAGEMTHKMFYHRFEICYIQKLTTMDHCIAEFAREYRAMPDDWKQDDLRRSDIISNLLDK
jgi:hypothetical protein